MLVSVFLCFRALDFYVSEIVRTLCGIQIPCIATTKQINRFCEICPQELSGIGRKHQICIFMCLCFYVRLYRNSNYVVMFVFCVFMFSCLAFYVMENGNPQLKFKWAFQAEEQAEAEQEVARGSLHRRGSVLDHRCLSRCRNQSQSRWLRLSIGVIKKVCIHLYIYIICL